MRTLKKNLIFTIQILVMGLALNLSHTETAHAQLVQKAKDIFRRILPGAERTATRTSRAETRTEREASERLYSKARRDAEARGLILRGEQGADPFISEKTGGIFSSFRNLDLIQTQGQEQVMSDMATALASTGKIGFVLTGAQGVGKNQLITSLEYLFRLKAKANPKRAGFVIRVNAADPDFKDIQRFRTYVNELKEMPEVREAGHILFYIDNVDHLVKGNSEFALDGHMDILGGVSKVVSSTGEKPQVKFVMSATDSVYESLIKRTTLENAMSRIQVKGSRELLDIQQILERNILVMDPYNTARMTDEKIARLARQAQRYFPGQDSAAKALQAFDNALARRVQFMTKPTVEPVNEFIRAYEQAVSKIQNQIQEVGALKGAHAKKLQQELPQRLAEARRALAESRREYDALVKARNLEQRLKSQLEAAVAAKDTALIQKLRRDIRRNLDVAHALSDRALSYEVARIANVGLDEVMRLSGRMTLAQFRKRLDESIYGQENLKAAIMRAARKMDTAYKRGEFDKVRPVYSLFITGDPGSGKTEALSLLSEFSEGYTMLKGAEYKEGHALSRLLGPPPGYAEHANGGALVNELSDNPRRLVHVDELEKANPEFFDILTQYMDPGTLTSGNNLTVKTNESILGITTNAVRRLEQGVDPTNRRELIEYISKHTGGIFKPEFMNRFDEILYVGPNPREVKNDILTKFLSQLVQKPILKESYVGLDISANAREALLDIVEKRMQGTARDIKTALNLHFGDLVSEAMEAGQYVDPLTRKVHNLNVEPGDLIRLEFDEAEGFTIKAVAG